MDYQSETCDYQGDKQLDKIDAHPNNTIDDCATLCNNTIGCKYFCFTKEKTCAVYSKCTATQTTSLIGSTFRKVLQGDYEIVSLGIKGNDYNVFQSDLDIKAIRYLLIVDFNSSSRI